MSFLPQLAGAIAFIVCRIYFPVFVVLSFPAIVICLAIAFLYGRVKEVFQAIYPAHPGTVAVPLPTASTANYPLATLVNIPVASVATYPEATIAPEIQPTDEGRIFRHLLPFKVKPTTTLTFGVQPQAESVAVAACSPVVTTGEQPREKYKESKLSRMNKTELVDILTGWDISAHTGMSKKELMTKILDNQPD